MKDIESVVAENMQELIDRYDLTHQELADIAGVSVSTVGKWTLKKAAPRMGAIQKISDYFGIPKSYILKEKPYEFSEPSSEYTYYPTSISAGLPNDVEGITEASTITLPDVVLGKHTGSKDIYITRVNGDSMNRIIPHDSLIAVKPVTIESLKTDDIVVYRKDNEYAVKRLIISGDKLIFKPESTDDRFYDDVVYVNDCDITIKGKVVTYIVNI